MRPRHLKVFKASAGSGKTFTLAVEYIKLLIADPTAYKHILAVTFTNKATAEMKDRIVNQLYGIGSSLSSSDPYLDKIKEDPIIRQKNYSDETIREHARQALSFIIHDYGRFHIETIDSFFQSIIKELARELDLTANLRIDLNDQEVLSEAVKSIIGELQDNSETFKSIIDFVMEKIEEGKNWNIMGEIEKFGLNIFNEHYLEKEQLIRSKIADKNFLREYKSRLQALKASMLKELRQKGQTFLDYCHEDGGLEEKDFKQGARGVYGFFGKLKDEKFRDSKGQFISANSYVLKCRDNDSEWAKSKEAKAAIGQKYLALLSDTLTLLSAAEKTIATTDAISAHINHLMMLNMINTRVRTLNQDANRFLLSDTARFLRDMIDGSDIPFIYERTGNRFEHIMIDEFQDTSALQWENFKPLLHNSLSQNKKCLIVGDVKQSIYRWRNSDWNILNSIENGEFADQIDPSTIASLDTNRRSKQHVVEFNNGFFSQAAKDVGDEYAKAVEGGSATTAAATARSAAADVEAAYAQVRQKVYEKNRGQGYVNITDIQAEKDGNDYRTLTLRHLKQTVDQLLLSGVRPNDITILIRYNKQIPTICQYFIDNGSEVKIVSEEAFRLSSSAAINIIMLAMKCVTDSSNIIARLSLAYLYQTKVLGEDFGGDIARLLTIPTAEAAEDTQTAEAEADKCPPSALDAYLPEEFVSSIGTLALTPLAPLAERLYEMFHLSSIAGQDAYLFSFYDSVAAFLQDSTADVQEFVTYWDETLKDKTIPENSIDGIRIMSIHKSKGLEFHTVIVPFCDWGMNGRTDNILWCEPTESPYSDLPLAPVNFNKTTHQSIFRSDYNQETLKNFVDNLNLIYVAFTRAESNLFVITGSDANSKKGYNIADVIRQATSAMQNAAEEAAEEDSAEAPTLYTIGSLVPSASEGVNAPKAPNDLTAPKVIEARFVHHSNTTEFRQSNLSQRFVTDSDEAERKERYISEGNLIHHMLELMSSPSDLDAAAAQLDSEGCFADGQERQRICRKIRKALANPRTAEWFQPHWTAFNERSILITNPDGTTTTLRPDRVITDGSQTIVIDYKTGKQSEEHLAQVSRYMSLLADMGHTNLRGYIWYIGRDEIIEVKRS